MKTSIQSVKGTREFYPEDMAARRWLNQKIREVSELFGYEEWDGPFLEKIDLYAAKSGEELVKEQSFVFEDRGGEPITLRPELTPSLARMIAQRQNQLIFPLRWWSFGPFWRYERPQKGRTREFFQWNIDLIGSESPEADAEIIAVAATFLRQVGYQPEQVQIVLNNRRLMNEVLNGLDIPEEKHASIFKLIDKRGKLSPQGWHDYAKEIGFKGQFLIEPKPKEPTKHQYDFDTATVLGFLRANGLQDHFKMNIEANHATLAGHTFQHELQLARINNALGSIDANQGDLMLGWDTDQFPTNIYETTLAMMEVIKMGGFTKGGLNFDAKVRRASFEPVDLFYGHIAGMDAFAQGFKIAYKIIEDGRFDKFIADRYASYSTGIGKDIVEGKVGFKELEAYILENGEPEIVSGRQEVLESLLNQYVLGNK